MALLNLLMRQEFRRLRGDVQILRHVRAQRSLVALQRQRVARNAVLQRQKRPQPRLRSASVVLHVHARAPAREHRQQRDHQHLVQVVALGVASPGVVNVLKNRQKFPHPVSPSLDRDAHSALSPHCPNPNAIALADPVHGLSPQLAWCYAFTDVAVLAWCARGHCWSPTQGDK